ncbi:Sec-independent protein translocase protein TatB [Phaeovulum vinaykumarii]|uniref:Sec-independent protein translocase protein TatB n=1 Tax=Phaeovulum vinaykumarii TaxID=407234 RepID=A0A1N7K466_9RHOB|nr:Sec-independent protein translocase protein TatB [Phaeovulum vinaykumarii]SIS56393.1 sec-independent protein translocase protein TatB [Phaeovulum vinaykumarii]SOB92848.1 sec-independent protein translocase protein TatB [Phaeovulum vinaykumarii]
MFDIGWSELLLIGIVALIVVGPKDLPGMFRTLGRFTAKARAMGREFSRAMEEAADDSGLKDAADDLRALKGLTSKKSLGLDALETAADRFERWEPGAAKRPAAGGAEAPVAVPDPEAPPPSAAAQPVPPQPASPQPASRPATREPGDQA